ncbi:hypothetical protein BAUCODRAFT_573677 [Baudoinia panamericana UAMH 10762]|uniref:Peptidase A1 domain-containing protein n=1 Tax=Baudoinia panamericana (strain UAMH 10762) TaxID=717646 RepID=M2LXC0_BAUPA|nr:uncharacterized protein BAUCODRAFT_573677 [Baudoinia panamericana UAMH 10762]EMC99342.1 hypothetical protein BAUCODRAFT_573677 [Baudoinia panamericana UAMH 10762]
MASTVATNLNTLGRTTFIKNPSFKATPLNAYAKVLSKFCIIPSIEGPLKVVQQIEQQGAQTVLETVGLKKKGYAVKSHTLVKHNLATGQTGQVTAQDVSDAEYLAPVTIGSPGQTMNLQFDSGSSDLWVFSSEMPADQQQGVQSAGNSIFDPSKSSTFQRTHGTWSITYGDGSGASGNCGTDNINIGGITIKNQIIELADTASSQFLSGSESGLCGLAFPPLNTVKPTRAQTPMVNMISQSDIPKDSELFTCYFSGQSGNSYFTTGYIDHDACGGATPAYSPVDSSQGFWEVKSETACINGKAVSRSGNTAIVDTGTSLCLLEDSLLAALYGALPGAKIDHSVQGWVYPTDTPITSIPKLEIAVGSNYFTIEPEYFGFADLGNGYTYGSCQSRGSNFPFDILGDRFLCNIYAIFDQGKCQFGAVQRTSSGATTSGRPVDSGTESSTAQLVH